MPLLEQQQPLIRESLGRDFFVRLSLVARTASTNLSSKRWSVSSFRVLDGKRDQDQIEVPTDKLPHQGLRDRLAKLQVGSESAAAARAEPQARDRARSKGSHRALTIPIAPAPDAWRSQANHAPRQGSSARASTDLLSLLGQLDPRFPALDEADLQLLLKLLNLHTERGLADSAGLGRAAEMPGLGQGLKVTELTQGHHSDKVFLC